MKRTFTSSVMLLLVVLSATWFNACRDHLEVYHIERLGIFSFSNDNLNTEVASEAKFFQGKTTLYDYSAAKSELLTRYLLQVKGTNRAGKNYSLSIEFDLANTSSFMGIYRPKYEYNIGGVHSFTYLEEVSAKTFKSYNLDPSALGDVYVRVQKQNTAEKLILGDFYAKLQNDLDVTDKIIFYQGLFKDISYVLQ